MARKYALHPGWVRSKTDGDEHYISTVQLARLYELRPSEYIVWGTASQYSLMYRWDDYIHLYPRYDGDYGRPDNG